MLWAQDGPLWFWMRKLAVMGMHEVRQVAIWFQVLQCLQDLFIRFLNHTIGLPCQLVDLLNIFYPCFRLGRCFSCFIAALKGHFVDVIPKRVLLWFPRGTYMLSGNLQNWGSENLAELIYKDSGGWIWVSNLKYLISIPTN